MNYNEIKSLINDIGNLNVDEVNIEFPDGVKINVKKNHQTIPNNISETTTHKETITIKEKQKENTAYQEVISPMVGTFYSKSAPTAKPFVRVGDKIKRGQVLCILEAMKLMNEIESECDGEIVEICVKDEDMVEFGQVLFKIK